MKSLAETDERANPRKTRKGSMERIENPSRLVATFLGGAGLRDHNRLIGHAGERAIGAAEDPAERLPRPTASPVVAVEPDPIHPAVPGVEAFERHSTVVADVRRPDPAHIAGSQPSEDPDDVT